MTTIYDRLQIENLVRQAIGRIFEAQPSLGSPVQPSVPKLVVSISARHVHLTDEHVEKLFGPGKKLTP